MTLVPSATLRGAKLPPWPFTGALLPAGIEPLDHRQCDRQARSLVWWRGRRTQQRGPATHSIWPGSLNMAAEEQVCREMVFLPRTFKAKGFSNLPRSVQAHKAPRNQTFTGWMFPEKGGVIAALALTVQKCISFNETWLFGPVKFCEPYCEVISRSRIRTSHSSQESSARLKGLVPFVLEAVILGWPSLPSPALVHKWPRSFCSQTDWAVSLQMLHFTKSSQITVLKLELLWQQVIRGLFFFSSVCAHIKDMMEEEMISLSGTSKMSV